MMQKFRTSLTQKERAEKDEAENNCHPIMAIPEEIRGAIFNKLSQKDALNLRLVCKRWYKDIENYYDFKIQLDDRSPYFETILNLRVKTCEIVSFVKTPIIPETELTLGRPNLLRELVSRTEAISSTNIQNLLYFSAEFLEHLVIERKTVHLDLPKMTQSIMSFGSNLRNLTTLKINITGQICCQRETENLTPEEYCLFKQLAENIKMPRLRLLKIQMDTVNRPAVRSSLISLILRLVASHWKSLEILNVELPWAWIFPEVQAINQGPVDREIYKKVDSLKKLRINIWSAANVSLDLWKLLIGNQKKLTMVEILLHEIPVPKSLCRQVALSNQETLVYFAMHNVQVKWNVGFVPTEDDDEDVYKPLDLSMFQNCSSLRKLKLSGSSRDQTGGFLILFPHSLEMINATTLPESIVVLELANFLISSEELFNLFTYTVDSRLKKLSLLRCGRFGYFGVNGSVLVAILRHPTLEEVMIQTFNYTDHIEVNILYGAIEELEGVSMSPGPGSDLHFVHLKRDLEEEVAWKVVAFRLTI